MTALPLVARRREAGRGEDMGAASVGIMDGKVWLEAGHQIALGGFGDNRASRCIQLSVGHGASPRHACADLWLCCSLIFNCKVS